MQFVTDLVSVHVVRRQRTWRFVVPVPAQRHRDGRTWSPLVCLRLHDEDRLVNVCLSHKTSVLEDLDKRTHLPMSG